MLVLSRKVKQSVQIAGDIRLTVIEIQGGRVKIGIDAPGSVRILREELKALSDETAREPGQAGTSQPRLARFVG